MSSWFTSAPSAHLRAALLIADGRRGRLAPCDGGGFGVIIGTVSSPSPSLRESFPRRGDFDPRWRRRRRRPRESLLLERDDPPSPSEPSLPSLSVELHAIGGFSCVSLKLPPATARSRQLVGAKGGGGGEAVRYGGAVHCIAAEKQQTVLRVAVVDDEWAPDAARDTRRARDTAAAAKQGRETMEADMTESASSSSAVEEWSGRGCG